MVDRQITEQPPRPSVKILAAVTSWPGVKTAPHRFGGVELRVGRRELGHLHGERIADLPFPRRVRDRLIAEGRARAHHVLPESGWVTVALDGPAGVEPVIELFRLSYERALRAQRPRAAAGPKATPNG
jgi:hypothetical protein